MGEAFIRRRKGNICRTIGHGEIKDFVSQMPTCTDSGLGGRQCRRCNEVIQWISLSATGHQYVDGVCDVCGEPDPDYGSNTDVCEVCGEDPCVCEDTGDNTESDTDITDTCSECGKNPCECDNTGDTGDTGDTGGGASGGGNEGGGTEGGDDTGGNEGGGVVRPVRPGGCVFAGTQIALDENTSVDIVDFVGGTPIDFCNPSTLEHSTQQTLVRFFYTKATEKVTLTLEDDKTIDLTPNHAILTEEGLKVYLEGHTLPKYSIGERVATVDGYKELVNIQEKTVNETTVYNIATENSLMVANGIIVAGELDYNIDVTSINGSNVEKELN